MDGTHLTNSTKQKYICLQKFFIDLDYFLTLNLHDKLYSISTA